MNPDYIAYNEKIAQYMGREAYGLSGMYCHEDCPDMASIPEKLKYHKSFDWILPVMDRIIETDFVCDFSINYCSSSKVYTVELTPAYNNTFINIRTKGAFLIILLNAVAIEFINWHNSFKNKK